MSKGAVITADIVNFTRLPRPGQKKLIADLSSLMKQHKFDFYRGDSFNVYLKHPGDALKLVFQFRASARKFNESSDVPEIDIRASIGIGDVDTPVRSLRTATGEAFTLSGRNLDAIIKSGERLIIASTDSRINPALKVIAHFMDYLIRKLTSKQAEVVLELSKDLTQTETAIHLNKSQPTINQHVQSADWAEISKLLDEYRQLNPQYQ